LCYSLRQNTPAQDPFSIFEHFGFGGHRRQHEEARTPNVEIPLRVTLRQLYLGEVLDVSYLRQVVCTEANTCQKNSKDCQGPGVKIRMQQLAPGFVQQIQVYSFLCCVQAAAPVRALAPYLV
jgi:DnaJ-class molecular chaperone